MVSSAKLTDDILIEIFAYLPLDSVYRFKSVSKVWLSNLSDPNFIARWFRINNKSLPWMLYYALADYSADGNPLRFKMAYHDLHSEFLSRNEHLFSFKFLLNQIQFEDSKLYLLGSSNGLVLSYSFGSDNRTRYHVCNPLTQKWVSLPSPPRSQASHLDVNGIFCEYSSSLASSYKVVRIPVFHEPSKKFHVDIFSSDMGVWRSFQVSCDENVVWGWSNFDKVVLLNSVLFWIEGGDRLLVYNLNQNNESNAHRCSLINVPDAEDGNFNSRIGESEGWLCYAKTKWTGREMTVSVWVLDEVNWKILHKDVSIDYILEETNLRIGRVDKIQVLGFSPVDRNVVLISWRHWVCGINVLTRSIQELCLDNSHGDNIGRMFLPFVLKTMPTVMPPPSWIHT